MDELVMISLMSISENVKFKFKHNSQANSKRNDCDFHKKVSITRIRWFATNL